MIRLLTRPTFSAPASMLFRTSLLTTVFAAMATVSFAMPPVATFGSADAQRLLGEVCNTAPASSVTVNVHRTGPGSMLYLASEDRREAVVFPDNVQCNQLDKDVLDVFRSDEGKPAAMVINKQGQRHLLIGEAYMRGRRFDVERTGRYFMLTNGKDSTIAAIARPYRTMLTIPTFAQRLFLRKRGMLVVGDNPVSSQLEAVQINESGGRLTITNTVAIPNMRAGVKVFDFDENSDTLLLGGVDASGQTLFVAYNLSSGGSESVRPGKPTDNAALFLDNSGLRARLTGQASPSAGSSGRGFKLF